jgi:hypothetical protein
MNRPTKERSAGACQHKNRKHSDFFYRDDHEFNRWYPMWPYIYKCLDCGVWFHCVTGEIVEDPGGKLSIVKVCEDGQRQPRPTGNGQVVLFEVLKDLRKRAVAGHEKYGTLLRVNNGRDALVDAYEEALDLCMYLKQTLMERDKCNED